jgi:hypothetical protein
MLCPYCFDTFEEKDRAPSLTGGEPCTPAHCSKPDCFRECPECADWIEAIATGEPYREELKKAEAPPPPKKLNFEEPHAGFLERLEGSIPAMNKVAEWARGMGKKVVVNRIERAPTRADAPKYSDNGDMTIDGKRYECKGITKAFTCREDWPLPDFIVDGKDTYDKKKPKPLGYYTVNQELTHAAFIDVMATRPSWYVEKRFVQKLQADRDFYFIPMELLTFFPLNLDKKEPTPQAQGDIPW